MEREKQMKCPYCLKEVPENAVKCAYCGEWLIPEAKYIFQFTPRSATRIILLWILSCGFYLFYWFYWNWKWINFYKKTNLNALFRTLGLLIPILNICLMAGQLGRIRKFARDAGIEPTFTVGWTVLGIIVFSNLCYLFLPIHPAISGVWAFLALYPLLDVQSTLNLLWERDKRLRKELSRPFITAGEIVLIIIGFCCWMSSIGYFVLIHALE